MKPTDAYEYLESRLAQAKRVHRYHECEVLQELLCMYATARRIDVSAPLPSEEGKLLELARAMLSDTTNIFVNRNFLPIVPVSIVGGAGNRKLCELTLWDKISHYRVEGYQLF